MIKINISVFSDLIIKVKGAVNHRNMFSREFCINEL